jgi:MFS family permease
MVIFSIFIGVASVQGFSPTIAKQLGYSPMVVGFIYTYLSILAFLAKPLCGYLVDKLPVKRILFLSCVLGCGLAAFLFNFVPKLPSETVVNFSCDQKTTTMDICLKEEGSSFKCANDDLSKQLRASTKSIKCQVSYVHWYIIIALLGNF